MLGIDYYTGQECLVITDTTEDMSNDKFWDLCVNYWKICQPYNKKMDKYDQN
jgi:hypothetical protein